MDSKNLTELLKAIETFSKEYFQKNYLNYLNEFDIHSELLVFLRNHFKDTNKEIYVENKHISNTDIIYKEFNIVRSEYYIQYNKVDIAILDPDKFDNNVNTENGKTLYGENVDCVIEIKLQAFNDAKDVRSDITKLLNLYCNDKSINYGISLLFSHSSDSDENVSYLLKNNNYSVFDESKNYDFKIISLLITPQKIFIRDCTKK